jgi:hypothetical protein
MGRWGTAPGPAVIQQIRERIVQIAQGLLAIHGIYDYQPLHRDRMQQQKRLRTADGQTLPPRGKRKPCANCSGWSWLWE